MKNLGTFLTIFILFLLSSYRLFRPGYFSMQDDVQVFRLWQYDKCIQDKQIPCRYISDGGLGYGYPLFNFYPPLPYIVAEIFHLFGFSYIDSIKVIFIIGFFLSVAGMYLFSQKYFGNLGGLLSAAFYLFAPYRAIDSYVRGSLGEFIALSILPFIFWSLTRKSKLSYILFLSSLFLTHNLTSLIVIPLVLLFLFFIDQSKIKEFIVPSLLSFGLCSFFLLPVIFEKKYTTINTMTEGYFNFVNHFTTLYQLFVSRFWGFGASLWGPKDDMSFQVGFLHWLIPLIVFILVVSKTIKTSRMQRNPILFFIISSLFLLFLTHSKSTFIWQTFSFLKYYQFPWRFIGLAVFCLSFIIGIIPNLLLPRYRLPVTVVIILLVIMFNLPYFKEDIWYPGLTDKEKLSAANLPSQSGAGIRDYWPSFGLTYPKEPAPLSPIYDQSTTTINEFSKNSNTVTAKINLTSNSAVTFPVVYFPGWQAYVDNFPQKILVQKELGLISLDLSGGNHQIKLEFKNSLIRYISNLTSITSIFLLSIFLLKNAKK